MNILADFSYSSTHRFYLCSCVRINNKQRKDQVLGGGENDPAKVINIVLLVRGCVGLPVYTIGLQRSPVEMKNDVCSTQSHKVETFVFFFKGIYTYVR